MQKIIYYVTELTRFFEKKIWQSVFRCFPLRSLRTFSGEKGRRKENSTPC